MKKVFRFKTGKNGQTTLPAKAQIEGIFIGEGKELSEDGETYTPYVALEVYAVVDLDAIPVSTIRTFAVTGTGEAVPKGSNLIKIEKLGRNPALSFWEIPATDAKEFIASNGGECFKIAK